MQQWVVFGRPAWYEEENPHPPAKHGDPPSPEINEIASRLQKLTAAEYNNIPDIGDGSLCEICAGLNLTRSTFIRPTGAPTKAGGSTNNGKTTTTPTPTTRHMQDGGGELFASLGLYKDVFARNKYCALCRLVGRVLDADYRLHNPEKPQVDRQENAEAKVSLIWTSHEDLQEVEQDGLPKMMDTLRVQLTRMFSNGSVGVYKSRLRIEPFSEPGQTCADLLLVGRVYGREIDVELLRTWMRCCEEWHAGECKSSFRTKLEHPAAAAAGGFSMHGIDVEDLQLKVLAEGDRYCALSYVWGKREGIFKTLKQDLERLLEPNGMRKLMDRLPGTIVGAIGLARDLGVRYLWVDSICIPQDDEAYKAEAIGKMHLVYSKAELTIVAASGPDSFYGLPGYGAVARDEPQLAQRVGKEGGLILGARARYQWSLAMSPHGQRGWTYQEMCFSTRSIVFMNGSVYFQCRQAVWREDWALEHPGVRFFLHEMDNRLMQNTDLLGQYRHSLREFTRRKLTFQNDAVNAYAGVLEVQRTLFGGIPLGNVCCGLHIGLIDWVILFYLGRGSKRHQSMPSWSWAGWIGEAFLPFPMFGSIQRLILWEQQHCPAGITYFHDLGFMGVPSGIKNVLRISTLAALLVLDPNTIDGPGFERPLWKLRDRRGHTCGYVTLHDSTFWDSFAEPRPGLVVQVLVLSDTVPGQGLYPDGNSKIPYDAESEPDHVHPGDEVPAPGKWQVDPFTNWEGKVRAEFDEKPLDRYNILVLIPYTKTVGGEEYSGFHERIGMGIIHNQSLSWALEKPSHGQFWIL